MTRTEVRTKAPHHPVEWAAHHHHHRQAAQADPPLAPTVPPLAPTPLCFGLMRWRFGQSRRRLPKNLGSQTSGWKAVHWVCQHGPPRWRNSATTNGSGIAWSPWKIFCSHMPMEAISVALSTTARIALRLRWLCCASCMFPPCWLRNCPRSSRTSRTSCTLSLLLALELSSRAYLLCVSCCVDRQDLGLSVVCLSKA